MEKETKQTIMDGACPHCHLEHDGDWTMCEDFEESAAPICHASWIAGDKPATPKGSSTELWVTTRHKESGKTGVSRMTYLNAHVMACSDQCDPPKCAVPHKPEEDGYCEEFEWTCWTNGDCEHCETEWVWSSHYVEIIAHAIMVNPEPFQPNDKQQNES